GKEDYYVFNDWNALMTYADAGADNDVARGLAGLQQSLREPSINAVMVREVGMPVCRAFAAFARGDYAQAVHDLFGVRAHAQRFGGSHAQRDILDLTLLEAARRDGQEKLVRGLLAARKSARVFRPESK